MSSRWKKFAAVLLCLLFLFPFPAAAEKSCAEDLTGVLRFLRAGEEARLDQLRDASVYTKVDFSAGEQLTLICGSEIASLYLKFDRPPGIYLARAEEETVICGKEGYLHEWIELPAPSKEITLTMPAGKLCGLSAYSAGDPPAEVQRWNPPYTDCDMLLLPTHADDEHLFFGSLLPTYAGQEGKKLQVAYLTNHWGEPYRPHELLDGLWEAGITAYPVISGFPDYYSESLEHAKTLYPVEEMCSYIVTLLRRFRPEVVIGHDLDGEYGHGVHQLNAWLLCQAVEQCEDPMVDPASAERYGTFTVQKTYLHLYPENSITIDAQTPLSHFEGKTAYEKAVDAFAHHKSQQQWFSVEYAGRYDFRKFGLYRSTVGENTGNDPFEHVTFSDTVIPEEPISSEEAFPLEEVSGEIPEEPDTKVQGDSAGMGKNLFWMGCGVLVLAVSLVGILVCLTGKRRKIRALRTRRKK